MHSELIFSIPSLYRKKTNNPCLVFIVAIQKVAELTHSFVLLLLEIATRKKHPALQEKQINWKHLTNFQIWRKPLETLTKYQGFFLIFY